MSPIIRTPLSPIQPVRSGDWYVFERDLLTRGGDIIPKGSMLEVIEPTGQIPYGDVGPMGHNWLCVASNGRTIWATLEWCISADIVSFVQTGLDNRK